MSTDKENNKLEDMKVEEKPLKEDVKKVEDNDVGKKNDKDVKEVVKDEKSGDTEPEKKDEKEKVATPATKKPVSKAKEPKKKVEKSEEEDEDEDGGDEEDDDENDKDDESDGKGVPLLDQPLQVSGARQRKVVERFSLADKKESLPGAPIEIPEGKGVSLGSISVVEYNVNKIKGEDLKKFHQLLFGRNAKPTLIKKNIRKFNGFDFDAESDQYEKKKTALQKLELKGLKEVAGILNLATGGSRDELAVRVLDFLMEPEIQAAGPAKATKTKALTKGGRPKRSAAAAAVSRGYSESDDDDSDERRAPRSRRAKGKRPNLKDESSSEEERVKKDRSSRRDSRKNDNEEEEDDDEEKKSNDSAVDTPSSAEESDEDKSKKKRTPAKPSPKPAPKKAAAKKPAPAPKKAEKKSAAPAKRKAESEEEEEEDESSEDEPLIKKTKAPPTDEEIKTYVKEILEGANLEEITMKTVCKQVYSHYPDFDLAHKKDFIKTTVKSLIST